MGLSTTLSTSLTGLAAAEAIFDVAGNNVANSNTIGFKSSEALFSTQFLQTASLGSGPTDSRGGTNPRQTGLGVSVSEISPNFTQGTIQVSNNPTDLAIQGDGFLIVQGLQGEQLYTRNGVLKTNSQNELVTLGGHRLMGHLADEDFEIQTTTLQPLTVPLGSTAVAQATENVSMQGTLSPVGDLADTPEIIRSAVLSDGTVEVPTDLGAGDFSALSPPPLQASLAYGVSITPPNVAAATVTPSNGAGTLAPGTYNYKIVWIDANGNEGVPSAATANAVVAAPDDTVTINNIPLPPPGFVGGRVYRSSTAGPAGPYEQIGADLGPLDTSFVDTGFAGGAVLDEGTGLPASPPGPSHYNYKIVYVDADGNEGPPDTIPGIVDVTGGNRKIHLEDLPAPTAPFVSKRVYRSTTVTSGQPGGPYVLVSGDLAPAVTTFTDSGLIGGATLNEETLPPGNFTYYVTFFDSASGLETRPTSPIGPQPITLTGRRIRLQNLSQPSVGSTFDRIKIYRNISTNDTEVYELANLAVGQTTFVDDTSDADLLATNNLINLDGPPISPSLNLVDVVRRENNSYNSPFEVGTLTFTGRKGGRNLTKQLDVTAATTVQDLITFMEETLGILKVSPDAANPIPGNPGGQVTGDSRIQFTGNNGVANAIAIQTAFTMETATDTNAVSLSFGSTQSARGEGAAADVVVYDSLGIPINVRITTVMEARDGDSTTYRWFADSLQNDPANGVQINVGTGLIEFDGEGNVINVTNSLANVLRENVASTSPLQFEIDFTNLSGLSTEESFLSAAFQDGSGSGTLTSFIIGEDGLISGVFSNGVTRSLGQIRLVRFANNAGLEQRGENLFAAGVNSGLPIEGNPGEQGIGTIIAGATELSNTDIGQNLIDLIVASTQYRGSARVITAAQQLLDELLNLRR
jgi:flagellar hook protein FlgE